MSKTIFNALVFCTIVVAQLAYGQTQQATFIALKGDVKLLKKPTAEDKNAPQAVYEGETYVWYPAKIGRRVSPNEVVQTGPNGKAKLVFTNGDHFVVGPGTSFTVPTVANAKTKEPSKLNMFYGKIRAMVSKGGPRSNMQIKTISATAGVRGTDFFISESGNSGCKITVMRGKVQVKPDAQVAASAKAIQPVTVATGYTAHLMGKVNPQTKKLDQVNVDIKEATREHLLDVQSSSTLKVDEKEVQELPKEQQKEVETLQTNTLKAILNDIKEADPKMYDKLKKESVEDVETVNTMVVSKLYSGAPSEDPKRKPTEEEINSLGQAVYEKYFQPAAAKKKK